MDNRLRFLYYISSELWGHRAITGPGNEKTGASIGGVRLENPSGKSKM